MPLLRKPIKKLSQTNNGYKRPYNDGKDKIRNIIDNKLNEPSTKKAYNAFVERLSQEKFENRSSSPKMMKLLKKEHKENLDKTNITRKKGEQINKKRKLSFNTDESLSQDVLNKKEIKTAYIEFMNHSMAKDKVKKGIFICRSSEELSHVVGNVKDGKSKKDSQIKMPTIKKKGTKTKSTTRKRADNIRNLEQVEDPENDDEFPGLSLEEKMNRIYEKRNVGLYVLCDTCNKARYLPHIVDPLDLPEKWYCHMNPDRKHNKCSDTEHVEEDPEFLINNLYNAGSIVFAKVDGFPWWPAMVEDDIDTNTYFWLDDGSMNPVKLTDFIIFPREHVEKKKRQSWYHITFFDSAEVTRAWTKTEKILAFKKNYNNPKMQLPKKHKYRFRMHAATTQALDALGMPLLQRLKKYGFIKRYRKPQRKHTKNTGKPKLNKKKKSLSPINEDAMSAILDNLSISDLSLNFF